MPSRAGEEGEGRGGGGGEGEGEGAWGATSLPSGRAGSLLTCLTHVQQSAKLRAKHETLSLVSAYQMLVTSYTRDTGLAK